MLEYTGKIWLSNLSCVIIGSLLYISLYFLFFFCCNVFIYLFGELHLHGRISNFNEILFFVFNLNNNR